MNESDLIEDEEVFSKTFEYRYIQKGKNQTNQQTVLWILRIKIDNK